MTIYQRRDPNPTAEKFLSKCPNIVFTGVFLVGKQQTHKQLHMKETSTLPALINAIREAEQSGNTTEATRLFLVLYAALRPHLWNAYCALLVKQFSTNRDSLRAEEVFQKILMEIEREIRRGKFVVGAGAKDKDVRVLLVIRICWKAVRRTKDAMRKWRRNPMHGEADLPVGTMQRIADTVVEAEEERIVQQRIVVVFGKMIPRDADILRTRFYSDLQKEDAERILMERYVISGSALEKAITRAKDRFRELWIAYLNSLETKPIPI